MREISKLLAKEGAVTGKGEVIQKGEGSRKMAEVDMLSQVDAVTVEFEIDKAENGVINSKPRDVSFTRYACLVLSIPR